MEFTVINLIIIILKIIAAVLISLGILTLVIAIIWFIGMCIGALVECMQKKTETPSTNMARLKHDLLSMNNDTGK